MFDRRLAWIVLGGAAFAAPIIAEGCAGDTENNPGCPNCVCGNGIKESNEACDDGNTNDADGCRRDCVSSTCGDGTVQPENGEECDDGDSNAENACNNTCLPNAEFCGNGIVEDGEDCDDGNTEAGDDCTNACTTPICGDGIVQEGEDCDDGDNEVGDNCPSTCMDGGGGAGGDPCQGQAIYAGFVTNATAPDTPGPGIISVWSYAGELGVNAGNEMCAAIGADHVCEWDELVAADAANEFAEPINANIDPLPTGTEFWVHRTISAVERLSVSGEMSPPGPGGRCNDWTYPTNHISDGEFGKYDAVNPAPAMARKYGNIWLFVDDDTAYEPNLSMPNTNPVGGDHACDGGLVNSAGTGTPGCSGSCGGADAKAIICCFPSCH